MDLLSNTLNPYALYDRKAIMDEDLMNMEMRDFINGDAIPQWEAEVGQASGIPGDDGHFYVNAGLVQSIMCSLGLELEEDIDDLDQEFINGAVYAMSFVAHTLNSSYDKVMPLSLDGLFEQDEDEEPTDEQ